MFGTKGPSFRFSELCDFFLLGEARSKRATEDFESSFWGKGGEVRMVKFVLTCWVWLEWGSDVDYVGNG